MIFLILFFAFHLSAELHISDQPITIIEGHLNRPEGIALSPEGDYLAVTSMGNHKVHFYKRIEGSLYENTPSFSFEGEVSHLYYPHDLSFSSDGQYLAVANRIGKSINIYKNYDPVPIQVISDSNLMPNAVKFIPNEMCMVVTYEENVMRFYRVDNFTYQEFAGIAKKPNGLACSPDGNLIAVASHSEHAIYYYQKVESFFEPTCKIKNKKSKLHCPHSLSFHPSCEYLAVSNGGDPKTVLFFKILAEQPEKILIIDIPGITFHAYGGVKGVSFSPDGTSLALCISDAINPEGAVLIYSVSL